MARSNRLPWIVELRVFTGLTAEETAAALGVAPITVSRYWAAARAWLYDAERLRTGAIRTGTFWAARALAPLGDDRRRR